MNYCIFYNKHFHKFNYDDVTEIKIKWSPDHKNLKAFCEKYKNKTIVVCVQDKDEFIKENHIAIFSSIDCVNFKFMVNYQWKTAETDMLKKNGFDFYFEETINCWDDLNYFINRGVSDVVIGGELGFCLPNVKNLCEQEEIAIRVCPNVCEEYINDICSFFIRPEDIDLYEPFIDIIEFHGESGKQENKYNIYHHKKWILNITNFIDGLDLEEDFPNNLLIDSFGVRRLNCKRICRKGENCSLCVQLGELAKAIYEKEGK